MREKKRKKEKGIDRITPLLPHLLSPSLSLLMSHSPSPLPSPLPHPLPLFRYPPSSHSPLPQSPSSFTSSLSSSVALTLFLSRYPSTSPLLLLPLPLMLFLLPSFPITALHVPSQPPSLGHSYQYTPHPR